MSRLGVRGVDGVRSVGFLGGHAVQQSPGGGERQCMAGDVR